MKLPRYLQVLLALTLLIVGFVFWRDRQATIEEAAPVRASATRRLASTQNVSELAVASTISKPAIDNAAATVNLFPPQTWRPPPPPSGPPSAPQPPASPFQVTGEWRYLGEQPIVMLQRGGESYVLCTRCDLPGSIRPGQHIGSDYRVDAIGEHVVKLTYLPLKHPYTLSFGAR